MKDEEYDRHNHFCTPFIDRVSQRRGDAEWLDARLRDELTRFMPVWRSKNLITTGPERQAALLKPDEAGDLIAAAESVVLLGTGDDRTYFALGLPAEYDAATLLAERGQFQGLRRVIPLLDTWDAALLAYAGAMVHWHRRQRFCGDCGSPTRGEQGGFVRVCTNEGCGQQHFPRMDPAIIVLVAMKDRCLLGRQPAWPDGMFSTIAGFVEPGESLEDAVVREVAVETGVQVADVCYHASQPWPFPCSLMLGFSAEATSEVIRLDGSELESARWFTRAQMRRGLRQEGLKLPMRASIAYRLIRQWFDAGDAGRLAELTAA